MNLINETPLDAQWSFGLHPSGRELMIVAVKGTYQLVGDTPEPMLCEEQVPLLKADKFGPDPATTAPVLENDFAQSKVQCDVLLHGSAYVPHGQQARAVDVRMVVGSVDKSIRVTGHRVWVQTGVGVVPSEPVHFASQVITYDYAFGGTSVHPDDPGRFATYLDNPVGRGFKGFHRSLDGLAMPRTEERGQPVTDPGGNYRPMSYGPLARNWRQRYRFAGTYDAKWMDERSPLWPLDFDFRYFQSSPEDQQLPFPKGGESIHLWNLVPPSLAEGRDAVSATVPKTRVSVVFVPHKGEAVLVQANLDTIVLDPDANRMMCTWRAVQLMERDVFDLREMLVGDPQGGLVGQARARAVGKEYVPGLGSLPPRKPTR